MERAGCLFVCVVAIFAAMLLHTAAAQTVHVVGDGMGWTIPTSSSVSYENWASARTFRVGDILEFNFMTNQHDVVQVPQASYDACSQDNAIGSVITTGPANITLDSAGDHHYICTFGRHCQSGQRLSITVVSSSSPPGGATPPMTSAPRPTTPSPATPQPDACAPTTPNAGGPAAALSPLSRPPPPSSASSSLASHGFLFVMLSAAIGFMF